MMLMDGCMKKKDYSMTKKCALVYLLFLVSFFVLTKSLCMLISMAHSFVKKTVRRNRNNLNIS
jgi:hypothetical protein